MKVATLGRAQSLWSPHYLSPLFFLVLHLLCAAPSMAEYIELESYQLAPEAGSYQPAVAPDGYYISYTYDNALPSPLPELPKPAPKPADPGWDTDAIELVTEDTDEIDDAELDAEPDGGSGALGEPSEESSIDSAAIAVATQPAYEPAAPEEIAVPIYDAEAIKLVPEADTGAIVPAATQSETDAIELITESAEATPTFAPDDVIEEPAVDDAIQCALEPDEPLFLPFASSEGMLPDEIAEEEPEVFAAAPPTLSGSITDANEASRSLFQKAVSKGSNLVFYPQGVAHALKVLYEASTEAGTESERKVRDELLLALPFISDDEFVQSYTQRSGTGLTLNSYLYLLARAGLKLDLAFATRMKRSFGAKFGQAASSTVSSSSLAKTINDWFATQTGGRIKGEVVSARDLDKFVFAVASALTIDGTFARSFSSSSCRGSFTTPGGSKTIQYFTRTDSGTDTTPYYGDGTVRAVKIALKDNDGEVILVRAAGRKDVLDALGTNIASGLKKIAGAAFDDRSLTVEVPELKNLKSSMELQRPLEGIGVKSLFSGPDNSFKSMITEDHSVGISTFRQVSAISWGYKGFKGAAATIAAASPRGGGAVRFDDPYIAIIKAGDGSILGLVYVANP